MIPKSGSLLQREANPATEALEPSYSYCFFKSSVGGDPINAVHS